MNSLRLRFVLIEPWVYLHEVESRKLDGELSYAYTEGERDYLAVAIDFKLLEGRSRFAVVRNRHADCRHILDHLRSPGCGRISAAITCYPVGHPAEQLLLNGDKEFLRGFDPGHGPVNPLSKGGVNFIGTVEPLLGSSDKQ